MSRKLCTWSQDGEGEDLWITGCGNCFRIDEGTPSENKMNFCCYCGASLFESPWVDDEWETKP